MAQFLSSPTANHAASTYRCSGTYSPSSLLLSPRRMWTPIMRAPAPTPTRSVSFRTTVSTASRTRQISRIIARIAQSTRPARSRAASFKSSAAGSSKIPPTTTCASSSESSSPTTMQRTRLCASSSSSTPGNSRISSHFQRFSAASAAPRSPVHSPSRFTYPSAPTSRLHSTVSSTSTPSNDSHRPLPSTSILILISVIVVAVVDVVLVDDVVHGSSAVDGPTVEFRSVDVPTALVTVSAERVVLWSVDGPTVKATVESTDEVADTVEVKSGGSK
mmetsp:Transcript_13146/g.35411  ORF Transcript_13146/g.35411 Transcript_13146/m.35411 type:complete len:275 (-) Transcript_13146:361-1185(-)